MNAAKVEFRVSNDGKFQWHKCSSNPEIRTIGEHAYYCVHEHRKQDDLIDNKNATVFENHKKSHLTLRAKRATFTLRKLAIKQCYQTGQFYLDRN